jgi:hypothetical protein
VILPTTIVYTTGDQTISGNKNFASRPNVNGTGVLLSGEAVSLPNTIVYTTGTQVISGNKTFINNIYVSGTGYFENINISNLSELILSGTRITISGNSGIYSSTNIYINGNPVLTGVDLSSYATTTNLILTGSTLDSKINSLSGSSVLLYGNQSIGGVKTFRDNVYINNLFVTGTETIVSTNNFNVQSPYILLNLTGGAVDGGIFFVTGAGLTGINDTGPIIGFDHSTKFKFGFSTRNSDLSTLPDIASIQDISAYSGFVDGKYAIISNLASTGSTLDTKINTLSGYITGTNSTFTTNLASTGSTLDTKINTLSGYITGTNSTFTTNLASTGSTLNTRINNLSGYINSSSSNIVFTTGNQTISGTKTFIQDTTFGDSSQGDFLVISGNNFIVYGSGDFTSGLFVNGNPVFIGSPNSIVYTTGNQTISGVKTFIGNHDISGNTTITGNLNVSGRITTPQQNKTFVYRPNITGGGNGTGTIAYGANCTLTPRYVGTLRADACISIWGVNGASADTVQATSFWYGTGTAPVYSGNLVNLGGTRIGGLKHLPNVSSTAISTLFPVGTSWVAEITGLNTGTQYWFDIGISGSNGRLRVQDVQLYIEEKY